MDQYNDEEKRIVNHYLSETLAQLDLLKKDTQEKDRRYSELFVEHEKQRKEFTQQNELLLEELEEMRQRYSNLKRQQTLFKSVRQNDDEESRPRISEDISILSMDDIRIRGQQTNRKELQIKLKTFEQKQRSQQDKLTELQRQNAILTDYINLKETTNAEKVRKLQQELRQKSQQTQSFRRDLHRDCDKTQTQRSRIKLQSQKENPLDSLSPIKHIEVSSQVYSLNDKIKNLEKEKKQLEAKVQKCTSIVKQLEDFYTKEIDRLNEQINQMRDSSKSSWTNASESKMRSQNELLQDRLDVALEQKQQAQKDLQDMQKHFEFALEQIQKKRQNERSEGEFSQFLLVQTLEKKYQNYISDIKTAYEQKLSEYEDKVNFLILKLQHSNSSLFDLKNSSQKLSSRNLHEFLAESKLNPDRNSNQLMRLTGSSFSSSIKESLTRKTFKPDDLTKSILERSNIAATKLQQDKTPLKNERNPFTSIFADRANIM